MPGKIYPLIRGMTCHP